MIEVDIVNESEDLMDESIKRQSEYARYVADKMQTAFSFKDWYAQQYGESISDDEIEAYIEGIRDDVLDIVEEQLMELNGR